MTSYPRWPPNRGCCAPIVRGFGDRHHPSKRALHPRGRPRPLCSSTTAVSTTSFVVGLSMGGWVATEFTLTYPARVSGWCSRRPAAEPSVFPTDGTRTSAPFTGGRQQGFDAAMALWLDDELFAFRAFVARRGLAVARARRRLPRISSLARTTPPGYAPPAVDRLSEISVPTLVIVGHTICPTSTHGRHAVGEDPRAPCTTYSRMRASRPSRLARRVREVAAPIRTPGRRASIASAFLARCASCRGDDQRPLRPTAGGARVCGRSRSYSLPR